MFDFSRERIDIIKADLKEKLPKKRYEHTLGVAYTSAALAMRYGEDIIKAELSGILHDIAKAKKLPKLKELMIGFDDPYTDAGYVEMVSDKAPQILHAIYAPYLAKKNYNIEDKDILSAIRWHTTGKKDMSILEKIVFVADYIEPNRKQLPSLDEIRTLAFQDITKAVERIAMSTIEFLNDQDVYIDRYIYELISDEV
ncbi:bis(5'-nucleosyl)-tetraphosphatase (symmetrical) YqeK [Lachnoanaerobaculum umeaense]|jgi:hydrolase, HD family|uniref:bis(5'-nucleosyl)-tetraphosphatase (symmetrical) n=1 Tax=Lachnoanaerobaculum umeaense TaxID=617123 RepID=A0A385Q0D0_9FIRM|nr:bis(5'-nucleosyl)-tetraphosphatase (symmetrical) YqeK [Lachnoanaerobaculum umeaense]AYA99712.1 HD domain-containing protein [Lachnoanaerobaculum umeaense]PZW97711.1 putative HD superfamily hydrolase involved in NAD metabolism [Lachnoanaerobaculum umeaense]